MKRFLLCGLLVLAMGFPGIAIAEEEGWESIFLNLSDGKEIQDGVKQFEQLYSAGVQFTITDGDGDKTNFDDEDMVEVRIKGNGEDLRFSGTKEGLVDWADHNRKALFQAVFGNSPDMSVSGRTNTMHLAQVAFITPIFMAPNVSHPGGARAPSGDSVADAAGAAEAADGTISFVPVSNKDIVISGQHDFMEIGDDEATGDSGIISYEWRFGESRANSGGISVPYRQMELDDTINTEYKHAALMPFFKHRWYRPNGMLEWSVNLTASLTYLKSDAFDDGGGYMEYGGGTGIRYSHALNANAILYTGLMYQGMEKNIPDDLVDEEVEWISETLNDLPFEHDLIPSVGGMVNLFSGKVTVKGEVFRVHQMQDEVVDGYENQTVVFGMVTWRPKPKYQFSLGYKESFELEDITDRSVIVDWKISW